MTLELIAVSGCVIGHIRGSTITGGTFTITSIASTKVKAQALGVYTLKIDFTFSGGSAPGAVSGSVSGAGVINATATKAKAEGQFVMRQGDSGTLTGAGTNASPPPPTIAVSGPVEIKTAGQAKVKAQ